MDLPVECEGAPRDLGLDQGRACAELLCARLAARPFWERAAPALGLGDRPTARDLARHFPHQRESLAGLARGAGVPEAWLLGELARAPAAEAAAVAALGDGAGLLARAAGGPWVVRRCRPEGLLASVEATRPWLTAALAGVNESGLAVVVAAAAGPTSPCAAPALLLAQDCLERFAALEPALEWCVGRPGGGRTTLLLADASGEVAGVEADGAERRVLRPADGLLLRGADDELAKALRETRAVDAAGLATALSGSSIGVDAHARSLFLDGVRYEV